VKAVTLRDSQPDSEVGEYGRGDIMKIGAEGVDGY